MTPGSSSTVHIYTKKRHKTTQLTILVGSLSGIRTQSDQTEINLERCYPDYKNETRRLLNYKCSIFISLKPRFKDLRWQESTDEKENCRVEPNIWGSPVWKFHFVTSGSQNFGGKNDKNCDQLHWSDSICMHHPVQQLFLTWGPRGYISEGPWTWGGTKWNSFIVNEILSVFPPVIQQRMETEE
jgi:hypothetical protein